MNIVVLCGGNSTEREVSIISGKNVAEALKSAHHNVTLLDVCQDVEQENTVFGYEPYNNFFGKGVLEKCKQADIVFLALHGSNGEDGKIQSLFNLMNIKYTGSGNLGSSIAMHKGISKHIFNQENIPNPKGKVIEVNNISNLDYDDIGFPMVIKPCNGGSSIGVSILKTKEELEDILSNKTFYDKEYVMEKYIKGREFSVGILDGKALPVIEIKPKQGFYDYENKYKVGFTDEICPAIIDQDTTKRFQNVAEKVHKALKLDVYSRIDFLMGEDGNIYCLEANTLPGMTPTSLLPQEAKAIGMSYSDLCEKIIELSLKKE